MEELDLMPNYLALYVAIMTGKTAEKAFISIGYRGMFSDEPKQRKRPTREQVQRMVEAGISGDRGSARTAR